MRLDQFNTFELSDADKLTVETEFSLVFSDCRLGELNAAMCREKLLALSGCYLWLMRAGAVRYKIYLGQTRSIQKRVTDYCVPFQIHSPNDFKLRFFEEAMREAFPDAALDLYFAAMSLEECSRREAELVRRLGPLINTLPSASQGERDIIRTAFRDYYRSTILRRLGP